MGSGGGPPPPDLKTSSYPPCLILLFNSRSILPQNRFQSSIFNLCYRSVNHHHRSRILAQILKSGSDPEIQNLRSQTSDRSRPDPPAILESRIPEKSNLVRQKPQNRQKPPKRQKPRNPDPDPDSDPDASSSFSIFLLKSQKIAHVRDSDLRSLSGNSLTS